MCITCVYSPTGDLTIDTALVLAWIMCQIVNVWGCEALPLIQTILGTGVATLHALAWIPLWLGDEITIFGLWANSNTLAVAYYLNGALFNGVSQITTAIYYSGGAHTVIVGGGGGGTIWDVLIALINQLGAVIGGLTNGLPQAIASIVGNVANVIITLINGILAIAFLVFNFVLWLLSVGVSLLSDIVNVISIVPAIISAFIQGFSQASYNTVSVGSFNSAAAITPGTVPGRFDCTDPIIYHVCLGMYVLDNTIFSGSPSLVTVTLQIAMGLVFINVLVWAIRRFQALKAT